MTMSRIRRLFTIKTRFEVLIVTYTIAVGAVERGQHYMGDYPGAGGWLLFTACLGTVFIVAAKLLDAVRPVPLLQPVRAARPMMRRPSRSRPRSRPLRSGSASAALLRKD